MQTLSPFDIVMVWDPELGSRPFVILEGQPSRMKQCRGVMLSLGTTKVPESIKVDEQDLLPIFLPPQPAAIPEQEPQKILIPSETKVIAKLTGRLCQTILQRYPMTA